MNKAEKKQSSDSSHSIHHAPPFNQPPETMVDEAGDQSFPASDPLAWNLGSDHMLSLSIQNEENGIAHLLAKEHVLIKKVTHTISVLIKEISSKHEIDFQIIQQIRDFLDNFVEKSHHQKEELLYILLHKGKDRPSDYLLKDLLYEHTLGRELLLHLQKLSKDKLPTGANTIEEMIKLLKDIHHLYLTHIQKEEEYILPVINQLVDKQEQKNLLLQFEKINKELGVKEFDRLISLAKKIIEK